MLILALIIAGGMFIRCIVSCVKRLFFMTWKAGGRGVVVGTGTPKGNPVSLVLTGMANDCKDVMPLML